MFKHKVPVAAEPALTLALALAYPFFVEGLFFSRIWDDVPRKFENGQ